MAIMLAVATLFWAQTGTTSSSFFENSTSGGYQLFEAPDFGNFADNPLNALEKIFASPDIAPECCNALNRGLDFDNATTTTVSGQVDPSDIRFSQNNISENFRDGSSVDDLVTGLLNSTVDPNSIPPIRVFEVDGQLVTLDNRRLYAYQQADIPIRVEPATPAQIRNESFKFTTENGGTDIDVRRR